MMLHIISIFVWLGLLCLNLDLGNRVFGSYRRSALGCLVRIVLVVLASILFLLPYLFLLTFRESGASQYLYMSCFLLSFVVTVVYLFPPKQGILPLKNSLAIDNPSDTSLAQGIILHRESIEIDLPIKSCLLEFLVISDLHCNSTQRLNMLANSIQMLKTQMYDAAFVLGDLTEKKEVLPFLIQLLSEIRTRYGVFCVRGNHDFEGGHSNLIEEFTQKQPVIVLSNRVFYIPELDVTLLGLEYPFCKTILPDPVKGLAIGLSHTPDNIKLMSKLGVAVAVSGHTHGGKFQLPFLGTILVPSRYGRFLNRGWFQFKKTVQYITPGIGYFPGRTGNGEILQLIISSKCKTQTEYK